MFELVALRNWTHRNICVGISDIISIGLHQVFCTKEFFEWKIYHLHKMFTEFCPTLWNCGPRSVDRRLSQSRPVEARTRVPLICPTLWFTVHPPVRSFEFTSLYSIMTSRTQRRFSRPTTPRCQPTNYAALSVDRAQASNSRVHLVCPIWETVVCAPIGPQSAVRATVRLSPVGRAETWKINVGWKLKTWKLQTRYREKPTFLVGCISCYKDNV